MPNLTRVIPVLIVTILMTGFPVGLTQKTSAQRNSNGLGDSVFKNSKERENEPPGVPGTGGARVQSWDDVFQDFYQRENEPPGESGNAGTRGSFSCAIAPMDVNTNMEIWSDRPLFVWLGTLAKLEIRSVENDRLLWSETVTADKRRATYNGEALEPGETYDWLLFDWASEEASPIYWVQFKVMDAQQRDRITEDLAALEAELNERGVTAERIAYARAQYFAERKLWSDFLQEVFSVENPSSELAQEIDTLYEQLCKPSEPQSNSMHSD